MAIRHGNKTYLQILLDPNRAQLLMQLAESQKVMSHRLDSDMVYKQLELCVPEAQYQEAFEADKKVWTSRSSGVSRRARLKKK